MRVVPIVEGHGEVEALPVLLRRFATKNGIHLEVDRPIRIPRGRLVKVEELQRAVRLAVLRCAPGDAVLVVLDADDDCAARLGPQLLASAKAVCFEQFLSVVLAVREFEAWFVAAHASLRARGKLTETAVSPVDVEDTRDAKGWLSRAMGRRYDEPRDQPAFAALFDFDSARACSSFDKLMRELERWLGSSPDRGSASTGANS